jgi:putative flippase GtrA
VQVEEAKVVAGMANGIVADGRTLHLPRPPAGAVERFRIEHPTIVQLTRYAIVGGVGTALNAVFFLVLRNWFDAVPANIIGLLVSTAVTTELNRRFTFSGAAQHRWRASLQDVGTVVFYAFYSSLVLVALQAIVPGVTQWQEALAVAAASVLGGLIRFTVLRYWVFAR